MTFLMRPNGEQNFVPGISILFFSAAWCPTCTAMKKAQTLEKFAEKHLNVKVQHIVIQDEKGIPSGPEAAQADGYSITALPTLVFEDPANLQFGELLRAEGALSPKMLQEAYDEALDTWEIENTKAKWRKSVGQ